MNPHLAQLSDAERLRLRAQAMPDWTPPMLATPRDPPFSREGWLYERKLDGARVLVFRQGGRVRLSTRNRMDRSATWFEVRDALSGDGPDLVVDGEIVAETFALLQGRMQIVDEARARRRARRVPVELFLFDILHLDGFDLRDLPLRTRKALLRDVVPFVAPLRFVSHREGDGVACWREACDRGWEGLIAKDGASTYRGERSKRWLKLKCVSRQELVVGGFTEPRGVRTGFGALLLGYYEGDRLRYAGKVGTGWDSDTLVALRGCMERIERPAPPFDLSDDLPSDGVHWVEPCLVAEVGFAEWTPDGKLRHPRYLGLRHDKDPRDVVREGP